MGILDVPVGRGTRTNGGLIMPRTRKRLDEFALRPVCNRTMVMSGTQSSTFVGPGLSNGTDTRGMYTTRHTTLVPFHTPRIVAVGYYNNNGVSAPLPNAYTLKQSIVLPGSLFIPVTWNNGQTSVVVQPGATVISDPVGFSSSVTNIPLWYTRSYITVANVGDKWPLSIIAGTGDGIERGTTDNDKTLSGTVGTAYERLYTPAAIVGVVEDETPAVAIVGDSISQGYNETYFNSFIAQALDSLKIPYVHFGAGSEQTGQWTVNQNRYHRSPLLRFCTHVIFENGVNSLNTTWANVESSQRAAWAYFDSLGLPVSQTTLTPQTTSTDTWTTLGGQTDLGAPKEPNRTLLNDLIRTLPAPLTGAFEIADTAMTARNSGIWKSDGTANKWTNDGTHPSSYGHAQMAAVLAPQIAAWLTATA